MVKKTLLRIQKRKAKYANKQIKNANQNMTAKQDVQ